MQLPVTAWTWTELTQAHARLSDAKDVLRDMEQWRTAHHVQNAMTALDGIIRRRSLEMQDYHARQLTLTHPGAHGEALSKLTEPF